MGFYIETGAPTGKADALKKIQGTQEFTGTSFSEIPSDKVLVCVVQNGLFDAAGIVYDSQEFSAFNESDDPRPKDWLLMDRTEVVARCPEVEDQLKTAEV